jgi:4-carboxymuconolactone decarboxylase
MNIEMPAFGTGDLPEELRRLDDAGALVNVFRMMLGSPEIALPVVRLGAAQFGSGSLPAEDRELAILTAATCFDVAYEISQHEAISASVGVSAAQRAAVSVRQWDSPDLSPAQGSLLRFLAAVAAEPTVPAERLDDVKAHYSDKQIVEAVILLGYYFMLGRVATVFEVPQDPPGSDVVLRAGRRLDAGAAG